MKPVVVNPLTVSKYAFVTKSNGFPLLNMLFQMNGIMSMAGRMVNVVSMSQRLVRLSRPLRSQKELKAKPTANDRKHVAIRLLTAWSSPFWRPITIGRIRNSPVICRKKPKFAMTRRRLLKL